MFRKSNLKKAIRLNYCDNCDNYEQGTFKTPAFARFASILVRLQYFPNDIPCSLVIKETNIHKGWESVHTWRTYGEM